MKLTKEFLPIWALSLLPLAASAKPILWTLHDAKSADGAVATGSFVYNAETGEYSGLQITTEGGNARPGATYIAVAPSRSNAFSVTLVTSTAQNQTTGELDLTGQPALGLFFTKPLGDAGGAVPLAYGFSLEATCANAGCTGFAKPQRTIVAGSLDGTPQLGGCPTATRDGNPDELLGGCGPAARTLTSVAAAPHGGFWVQIDGRSPKNQSGQGDSKTLALNGAPKFDNIDMPGRMAAIPGREGYFVVTSGGKIYSRGDAPTLCNGDLSNCSAFAEKNDTVISIAVTPDGQGLWAATYAGKVFTAGNAVFHGQQTKDSHPCTGIVALPSGEGYYLVFSDGGVYSFNATFHGSAGKGTTHTVGLAGSLDLSGNLTGYWMVGSDGGIKSFDAPFLGSSGGNAGYSVTGITSLPDGHGYAWVPCTVFFSAWRFATLCLNRRMPVPERLTERDCIKLPNTIG